MAVKFPSLFVSREGHDVTLENLGDRTGRVQPADNAIGMRSLVPAEIETSVIPTTSTSRKENTPVSNIAFLISPLFANEREGSSSFVPSAVSGDPTKLHRCRSHWSLILFVHIYAQPHTHCKRENGLPTAVRTFSCTGSTTLCRILHRLLYFSSLSRLTRLTAYRDAISARMFVVSKDTRLRRVRLFFLPLHPPT